jgi:toxin ParE1/3/4
VRYVLSQEAELDLLEIYEYSLEEWDEGQAVAYLDGLYDAFAGLTRIPKKGRLRTDLGLEIRSILCKSHIIFYLEAAEGVAIVRVLHQARDVEQAFSR